MSKRLQLWFEDVGVVTELTPEEEQLLRRRLDANSEVELVLVRGAEASVLCVRLQAADGASRAPEAEVGDG